MAAEGSDLDDLVPAEPDVSQTETATDQETVAKKPLDLLRSCVGTNVKVFRGSAQQEITYAAADQVGQEAMAVQPVKHLEGIPIDLAAGNAVGRTGQYLWLCQCCAGICG